MHRSYVISGIRLGAQKRRMGPSKMPLQKKICGAVTRHRNLDISGTCKSKLNMSPKHPQIRIKCKM